MKITIVRHGQTESNFEGIMQGRSNHLMNDTGRRQCQKLRDKLKDITLTVKVKAGENGKIFGGVTSKEISEQLKAQYKLDVDKKKIELKETIKTIGVVSVNIKLFEGVNGNLKVKIEGE